MKPAFELLLADLAQRGIRLAVAGDRLHYTPISAMTPQLLERLRLHKAELRAVVDAASGIDPPHLARFQAAATTAIAELWESAIEPPPPCPQCGSLELWWNLLGEVRCLRCETPKKANTLRKLAERKRHKGSQANK